MLCLSFRTHSNKGSLPHSTATMDTPNYPTSLGERQVSTQPTTPLLLSSPSTEDQSKQLAAAGDNVGVPASTSMPQIGDQNEAVNANGAHTVEIEIDVKGGETLQNGSGVVAWSGDTGIDTVEASVYNRGTSIPIREEFRCRRFWFFYHDIRALTTSVSLMIKGMSEIC